MQVGPRGSARRAAIVCRSRTSAGPGRTGEEPIPASVDDTIAAIRQRRATMAGRHVPMMSDILRVQRDEGLSIEAAVRAFGARP